jgi:hypothetical protein
MCRLIRVLLISIPFLFVFLVAPSTFAQSWVSAITATTTTTTATITWTSAVPANSQIKYGRTTSYGSKSALNSNLVATHSVALTSLTAGTTYHYRVLSADCTGVLVTGLDNVFTTPATVINVSISPTTATMSPGGTEQFSAQVTNTSNTAVTWSATSGTVSTTGLFTAPTVTATTTVTVTATSVADNTKSASATVTVNATVGTLGVSPATLALGSVVVGTSGTASGTFTAGGSSVTVSAVSSNNSAFTVTGLSLPVTIPAGNSAAFTVTFSPQTTGAATAALTFTSTAQSSTTVESLTGTGTVAPVYSVNLSWNASTSENISGYNIYRAAYASACGSFSKINSLLNTGTLYTDSVVVDGATYCYATTAVNTGNEESGYSNIVSNVQVPAP